MIASEASALASTTVESVRQQAYNLQQIMSVEEENDKQHKEGGKKIENNANEVSS